MDERPPRGGTILVVDDTVVVLALTAEVLEAAGYAVIPCLGAAAALAASRNAGIAIDLLVTDLVLPEMSGKELAERVAESRPRLPVIFTSGYLGGTLTTLRRRNGDAEAHLFGPPVDFLEKPFDRTELLASVRQALDGARWAE